MLFITIDDIVFTDGFPTIDKNNNLLVVFLMKFDINNAVCASGTESRRKRAVTLTDSETLLSQTVLLQLIDTQ